MSARITKLEWVRSTIKAGQCCACGEYFFTEDDKELYKLNIHRVNDSISWQTPNVASIKKAWLGYFCEDCLKVITATFREWTPADGYEIDTF